MHRDRQTEQRALLSVGQQSLDRDTEKERERGGEGGGGVSRERERERVACWLLNVPATCECISGTDLLRQFYVLPH